MVLRQALGAGRGAYSAIASWVAVEAAIPDAISPNPDLSHQVSRRCEAAKLSDKKNKNKKTCAGRGGARVGDMDRLIP